MLVVENLRRNICSTRQERNLSPLFMDISAILVLPIDFKTTVSQNQFLLSDNWCCWLNSLQFKQHSFSLNLKNGTQRALLKFVHRFFYQLYTFHTIRSGRTFPRIFILLPNKTKATHRRLMVVMFNLSNGVPPTNILFEGERVAISYWGKFRRGKFFFGENFRHPAKILSIFHDK